MKINHIGYIVDSIDVFAQSLFLYEVVCKEYDPIQRANLALYKFDNINVELIEPKSPESFTWSYLKDRGSNYHHLCYEVKSLDQANDIIKQSKMVKVFGPVPAILFDNRLVIFAFTRNKEIVEFLIN